MTKRSGVLVGAVALTLVSVLFLGVLLTADEALGDACTTSPGLASGVVDVEGLSIKGLTSEQSQNAAAIVAAGAQMKVPAKGQAIALMTAYGESTLRILDYGDGVGPDSRGLFQQRDNGAWGSYEDRMDATRSSQFFYRALLKVNGWESMAPTLAAHTVQRNADPYHYEKYWERAVELLGALTGDPETAAALAQGASTQCDQAVLAGGGDVVFPIPASLKHLDRKNWGNSGGRWSSKHTGTDFSVPCGTPVFAATAGTVVIDRTQAWAGPWLVKVSSGPTSLTTWYAHMQAVHVRDGQKVVAGQRIGDVGTLGNSTGCHLHFEVHPRNGSIYEDNVNPSTWLAEAASAAATTTPS